MDELNVRALMEAVQERAPGDDPLILLETAIVVAGEISGAADDVIEHYVGAARAANVSWTLIEEQLGVPAGRPAEVRAPAGVSDVIGGAADTMVMAPRLWACLEAAQAAAAPMTRAGHPHLLLGLLHAGAAASILDRLGVTRDEVRQANARLSEPS